MGEGFDVNHAFNTSYFLAKHGGICLGFHAAHDLQGMTLQICPQSLRAAGLDFRLQTAWFISKDGQGRAVKCRTPQVFINEFVGGASGKMTTPT